VNNINSIFLFFINWLQIFTWFFRTRLMSELHKDIEILALRSQLSIMQQEILNNKIKKPLFTPAFRQLWVLISKTFTDWKSCLILVKPETVISWHKKAFKFYWGVKSKKAGRPGISSETIALIKRIHKENPLLSPEKIHERLVNLSVIDAPAPNTIAKYIPDIRKPSSEKQKQSWRTFLDNHRKQIWSMDFFKVPTLCFKILYVFVIISHDRRKIEHFAVTTNPSSAWVSQQIREATPYGRIPKYLIHDNDSIFTSNLFQNFLLNLQIYSKRTGFRSPWQNGICERVIGTLRNELLNHVIPINQQHLEYLLHNYLKYYNSVRTHQSLNCQTPIISDRPPETSIANTVLISEPILGGLYHSYIKAA